MEKSKVRDHCCVSVKIILVAGFRKCNSNCFKEMAKSLVIETSDSMYKLICCLIQKFTQRPLIQLLSSSLGSLSY